MRATYSASCGVAGSARRAEDVERVLGRQRRHVNHLEARRPIAQQPQRAGDVAAASGRTGCRWPRGRRRTRGARGAGPGKLSNVRSSRNSSSRNVAGSPAAGRGRGQETPASRRTRRGRRPAPARRPETATRPRRRAETARASSPCARRRCTAPTVRPSRSRSCCSSVVRPLPHPPSSTGMRDGDASSAATTRRVRVERGVNMRVPRACDEREE